MMICTVNGQQRQWTTPVTVAGLLTELNLRGQKIAVEKNGTVIPRSQHHAESLADGDVIEIVAAVGGG